MMSGRLGILNVFLTYDILNLLWVYWDRTSSIAEKDLYIKQIQEDSETQRKEEEQDRDLRSRGTALEKQLTVISSLAFFFAHKYLKLSTGETHDPEMPTDTNKMSQGKSALSSQRTRKATN